MNHSIDSVDLMLNKSKALMIGLSIILNLMFGFTPVLASRTLFANEPADSLMSKMLDRQISLSMSLAGGILLATFFTHLIPEVRTNLAVLEQYKDYPLAELLVCTLFFLVCFIQEFIRCYFFVERRRELDNEMETTPQRHNEEQTRRINSYQLTAANQLADNVNNFSINVDEANAQTPDDQIDLNNNEMPHVHNLRSFFVVLALSFHSIVVGLTIGLEENTRDAGVLYFAVSAHECIVLFRISIELVILQVPLMDIVLNIIVHTVISPFSILLGSILVLNISEVSNYNHSVGIAVLQSLATGSMLYVTFYEVLYRERKMGKASGLIMLLYILLGFCLVVTYNIFK